MELSIRKAKIDDLPTIIHMLADDFLGARREKLQDSLPESYVKAFYEIESDPNNELIVAEQNGEVIGTLQLTYTPSLSYQGGKRATVESVRVDTRFRGQGIGREMMLWAIERARAKGCVSMQLTSHADRKEAHRFYENLGFKATHVGMKFALK
jgi:ribosomal protein S18 acetylase RimI-like enzyme